MPHIGPGPGKGSLVFPEQPLAPINIYRTPPVCQAQHPGLRNEIEQPHGGPFVEGTSAGGRRTGLGESMEMGAPRQGME